MDRLVTYAATDPLVRGVLLVGSWARGAARMESDIDLVLLAADPDALAGVGPDVVGGRVVRRRSWGALEETRLLLPSGLEVEVGVVALSWAATDPVDAGTRRVVTDGHRILYDPDRLLVRLAAACR